jgi:hypothetical protein
MSSSNRKKISRLKLLYFHYKRALRLFSGFYTPSFDPSSSKSKLTKAIDYLYIFFVLKIMPNNYHLFRLDSQDRSHFRAYLGDTTEPIYYNTLRKTFWSQSILVHDKHLFKCLCQYHGLPVPRNYAILRDNQVNGGRIDLHGLMLKNGLKRVIVKPVFGGGGRGIHLISIEDSEADVVSQLQRLDSKYGNFMQEGYLIEEMIQQHPELDRINPHAINSIRIISILNRDRSVAFLAAMLKTNSTNQPMDNFSQGGIVIGIDLDTGRLKKDGVMQYPQGKIFKRHPLTQTEFLNFQLPFWPDLKEIASKAQAVFYHVKSVGWDIAITPGGPVIIEGNQNWGTNGIQAANGGLLTPRNKALFAQYGISFYE